MTGGKTAHCWSCGAMLPATGFGRSDTCSGCSKDTRVCLNCRFHDPGSYNECRETVAERVLDKERATFCDLFKSKGATPRMEHIKMSGKQSNGNKSQTSVSAARAAAEALFKRN
ncbi:MAG: hypothetical protein HQL94_05195 [Magnetococcales bacterium]|nr:hypothetical protein [Magnetococcales bacterium]MBF0439242.1 hypothetical protein [Magnetococcales bacterium]